MQKHKITLEEATKLIEEYPNEDDFICRNCRGRLDRDGEYDDNSIELSDYWRDCQQIVKDHLLNKHG